MRTFTMGDIHGCHKGMLQCFERSGFNKKEDTLIQLGDVADGWSEVDKCVQELLDVTHLIPIRGNHDDWLLSFLKKGRHPVGWGQGGKGSMLSYFKEAQLPYTPLDIPEKHRDFFYNQIPYYLDKDKNLFVHGGINRHYELEKHLADVLYWDRDLLAAAVVAEQIKKPLKYKEDFKNIFIGHTQTTYFIKEHIPMFVDKVINLDTGAGWDGRLTIMNVETKEYFQSDPVRELYPNENGRNK